MNNITELKLKLEKINVMLEQMGELPQSVSFTFDFSTKKAGDFINIKFNNGLQVVLKKIGQNTYEVVNNGKSIALLEGDLVRIDDSKQVTTGDEISMSIFRKIGVDYETNPVSSID